MRTHKRWRTQTSEPRQQRGVENGSALKMEERRYAADHVRARPLHTPAGLNRAIRRGINESVRHHAAHPERIDQQLAELDCEWDIERTLEANAATLAFTGVVLGATVHKRWLALPALVTAFCSNTPCRGGAHPSPCCAGSGFAPCERSTRNGCAEGASRGLRPAWSRSAGPRQSRQPCSASSEALKWLLCPRMAAFRFPLVSCSGWGWAGSSTASSCTKSFSGITC